MSKVALEIFVNVTESNDDSNNPSESIMSQEFLFEEHDNFVTTISNVIDIIKENRQKILILDMHNVADVEGFLNNNIKTTYPGWIVFVLSYVGRKSKTRNDVTNKLKELLKTNSIDIGMLSFERGKTGDNSANEFVTFGGKASIINILTTLNFKKLVFIDDSSDHICSTNHLLCVNNAKVEGITETLTGDKLYYSMGPLGTEIWLCKFNFNAKLDNCQSLVDILKKLVF